MHGAPLRSAPLGLDLLLAVLMALVAPLLALRLPALIAGLATPVAALLFALGAQLAFDAGLVVAVVGPLTALVVGAVGAIAWSQLAESRARRAVARDNELLEARVRERTQELRDTQVEVLQRLGVAVEWRDAETGLHIERIGRFCERLALAVGMPADEAELLRHASALHDVGKVGIPDHILGKPGPLDPDEWTTMKTHTTIGASILAGSSSELVELSAHDRPHPPRALERRRLSRAACRASRSRWRGASARSATSSTPCCRRGPTRIPGRSTTRSSRSSGSAAPSSIPSWCGRSCRSPAVSTKSGSRRGARPPTPPSPP